MAAPHLSAPPQPDEIGADTHSWIGVIRRSRLAPTVKFVALTLASYADPDGTRVFPGLARLVYECGAGYSTIRRALADLKAGGLLELVRRGNRRRGQCDEYRLVLTEDLLDRVDVPSPEEARRQIDKISAHMTGAGRERQRRISAHLESAKPVSNPAEPVDNSPAGDQHEAGLALTQEDDRTRSNAHLGPTLALTQESAHLSIDTYPRRDRPSLLAGDLTSRAESKRRPTQSPLLGVIDGELPDHPVDGYQLTLPVEIPMPAPGRLPDPARAAIWPVLGAQLARINAHGELA